MQFKLEFFVELLCPAGNLPALKTAIDNGADAVYIGLKDDTNARHFAGLNFNDGKLAKAADYVHQRGKKLHVAINTFAHASGEERWKKAVDNAVEIGTDALIIADLGVLDYAATKYPDVERHVSVQASTTNLEAIKFFKNNFDVERVVLPRVLSVQQVRQLANMDNFRLFRHTPEKSRQVLNQVILPNKQDVIPQVFYHYRQLLYSPPQ
jgi:collagenase-like PrtC family protease